MSTEQFEPVVASDSLSRVEAEDDDSRDEDSAAETGTNLHASLLNKDNASVFQRIYYYCKCAVWKLCDFQVVPQDILP